MFPGVSPIYVNPAAVQTNVPPVGNDPGWSLVAPNVTIPNIPAGATSANLAGPISVSDPPKKNEKKETKHSFPKY
jgi:hypothetical protein